jgi:hypothetical protein
MPDGRVHDLQGATAQCKDGSVTYGKPGSQTCAGNGGVWRWLAQRGQDLIRGP